MVCEREGRTTLPALFSAVINPALRVKLAVKFRAFAFWLLERERESNAPFLSPDRVLVPPLMYSIIVGKLLPGIWGWMGGWTADDWSEWLNCKLRRQFDYVQCDEI